MILAGVALWCPTRRLDLAGALLGCALLAFAGWLTAQLLLAFRRLQANVMVVPRLGPGLFVVLAGALLAAGAMLARVGVGPGAALRAARRGRDVGSTG